MTTKRSRPGRKYKLTIELVPQTCVSNLRTVAPKEAWQQLSTSVLVRAKQTCQICGAYGPRIRLNCHEEWRYDDAKHRQSLSRLVCLCSDCHNVKHAGQAHIQWRLGNYSLYWRLRNHFARVNHCAAADFDPHYQEARRICAARSTHKWRTTFGPYTHIARNSARPEKSQNKAA